MSKSIANRLQAIQKELREIQHLHHDQAPTFWAVLTAWEATDLAIHVVNQSKPKILAEKMRMTQEAVAHVISFIEEQDQRKKKSRKGR